MELPEAMLILRDQREHQIIAFQENIRERQYRVRTLWNQQNDRMEQCRDNISLKIRSIMVILFYGLWIFIFNYFSVG